MAASSEFITQCHYFFLVFLLVVRFVMHGFLLFFFLSLRPRKDYFSSLFVMYTTYPRVAESAESRLLPCDYDDSMYVFRLPNAFAVFFQLERKI